ncbi:hypothetical protein GF354_03485 [Candidatus Peregrinibacteria bacterium]|nr:hypothetical protein [Candidatus Peregrinibacteria bacterium]
MAKTNNKKAGQVYTKNAKSNSTQSHLRIGEIRDDLLVLKNGGVRSILKTTSINFNLKSEEEQNAIIGAYQNFINSLEFPIQILVKSKKLDLDDYTKEVKKLGDKQENKLLQEQTYEYAQYITKLIEYADIMEKNFYVIVPYDPGRARGTSRFQSFFQRLSPKDSFKEVSRRFKEFDQLKKSIGHRINIIEAGLENCGLKVEQLKTDQIIALLYGSYNPQTARTAKIKNFGETSILSDTENLDYLMDNDFGEETSSPQKKTK